MNTVMVDAVRELVLAETIKRSAIESRLGISRQNVRSALLRLKSEGVLVDTSAGVHLDIRLGQPVQPVVTNQPVQPVVTNQPPIPTDSDLRRALARLAQVASADPIDLEAVRAMWDDVYDMMLIMRHDVARAEPDPQSCWNCHMSGVTLTLARNIYAGGVLSDGSLPGAYVYMCDECMPGRNGG
jgi:hypothetical protein